MELMKRFLDSGNQNFLFVGEAGSGKSEIAVNFAVWLQALGDRNVHFFDMDMTKPLFRSRDIRAELESQGIKIHYEEQFMDAPTLVGGVRQLLKDPDSYVIMDVGGDYIGARSIGGFAPDINQTASMVWYVINAYRPWSYDMEHIDRVLGEILGVSHISLDKLHLISNPNTGTKTSAAEVVAGHLKTAELVTPYKELELLCVKEDLYETVAERMANNNRTDGAAGGREAAAAMPLIPIHLYLTYPWLTG